MSDSEIFYKIIQKLLIPNKLVRGYTSTWWFWYDMRHFGYVHIPNRNNKQIGG